MSRPPFRRWSFADGSDWTLFYRLSDGYLVRFPGFADFEISHDGLRVEAWAVPVVEASTVEHLYLNQVLPLALSQQKQVVLHASAVEVDGNGIAFAGESGRGKSTLAAAFATTGYRLLTDDGLQLEWSGGKLQAIPSHPSVRLWEDSQRAVIRTHVEQAPALAYTPKVRLLAGGTLAYCDQLRLLRRVYALGDGSAQSLTIAAMHPAEAFFELAKNSFLLDIEEQESVAWHFDELVRLAELPIYFRLDFPRRYEDLPAIQAAICKHVATR